MVFATPFLLMPAVHAQTTNNAGMPSPVVVEGAEEDPLDQGVVVQPNPYQEDADPKTAETSIREQNSRAWKMDCGSSHHSMLAGLRTLHEHVLALTQIVRESAHGRPAADSAINAIERNQQNLNPGRR